MKVKGSLQISGTTEGITFTDGTSTYAREPKLSFSGGGFYLSADAQSRPVVNLRAPAISFTDGISILTNSALNRLSFSNSQFYLSSGTQGPVVNQRNTVTKALSLEFPGASENIFVFRAHEAMRIVSVRAVLVGSASPSVTFSVKSGTDRSSLGVTHTTSTAVTATTTGGLLDVSTPAIPAGSWVCLVSTAQSGTVTELDLSMQIEFT
jgi:hypothetical protein